MEKLTPFDEISK